MRLSWNMISPSDPPDPQRPARSSLERIVPYTTIALIIAVLYVGWTFYSRHEANRKAAAALATEKTEKAKQDANAIFGSGELKFTNFSIDKSVLTRGDTAQLCYGVVNARSVKIDPPIEQIKPSYQHCIQIAPKVTTTYTITAVDNSGATKSASLTLPVR